MNKAQSEFYDDLSKIALMARGHVVKEVYEKWKHLMGDEE